MREIERDIIDLIQWLESNKVKTDFNPHLDDLFEGLIIEKLSEQSGEFLYHPKVKDYILRHQANRKLYFWYLVVCYLQSDSAGELKAELFDNLESFLEYEHKIYQSIRTRGCALLPDFLSDRVLIKNVYTSGDGALIFLIRKYAPLPPKSLFDGGVIPAFLVQHGEIVEQVINHHLIKNDGDINKIEESASKIQRGFRKRLRLFEEKNRLEVQHEYHHKILHQANKPYIPQQCERSLAARLVRLSQEIELYSTIRHITSSDALSGILNHALYGRRNLLQFYIPFKPAALMGVDVDNGDGNVICFGPKDIDPMANGDIEIVMDLKKIISSKPSAFYKVIDLAYDDLKIRCVKLNDQFFSFSPTRRRSGQGLNTAVFQVFSHGSRRLSYYAEIPNSLLIAYDLINMNQILILNFFRFMDNLVTSDGRPAKSYIDSFYAELASMDDKSLTIFLRNVASELTKTAEFNFYGAYRIDFSAVVMFRALEKDYTVTMTSLLEALSLGHFAVLHEASEMLPSLFKSYRFIDYLMSKISNPASLIELSKYRVARDAPALVNVPQSHVDGQPQDTCTLSAQRIG